MLGAGALSSQAHLCGCQLKSRRVQAKVGRRCSTIRAATALPAEVRHLRALVDGLTVCAPNAVVQLLFCLSQFKNVSPVGDRVYVKVDVNEETTSSGLLLPVSAQKRPTQGEIVGAGTAKAVKVSACSHCVVIA